MFGLGLPELIVIFVIALIIFGPKKLPELGKSIGRAMAEFKKASEDFQESVRAEMKEVENSTGVDELKKLDSVNLPAYDQTDAGAPTEEESVVLKPKRKKRGEAAKNA